jgi:hypothetical protein
MNPEVAGDQPQAVTGAKSNPTSRALLFILYWGLPSLLCLWLYWKGLHTWFFQDDFAWLGLRLSIFNFQDFLKALFAPMAQGTIRVLSERGFFLLFEYLFGLDALPFRIFVFATQFANLILLSLVARRLTGSKLAGFLAPVLWTLNSSLATAMSWTSSYNQVLCAFFLLSSFLLFLRYTESGERRFYVAQWITFLIGFGALELNVVYPAIVFAYCLLCRREYLRSTLPMFAASIFYFLLHRSFSAGNATGAYQMHFDLSIFATLWTYIQWMLGPTRLELLPWGTEPRRIALFAVLLVALLGFTAWQVKQRRFLALFCWSWFLIVLAPLLPLRDHLSDYYLTIPTIGIAILAAWAISLSVEKRRAWLAITVPCLVIYTATHIPLVQVDTEFKYERGRLARAIVLGVERAHEIHPNKLIVLHQIDAAQFWSGVADNPFRLFGAQNVYLSPESQKTLAAEIQAPEYARFALALPALAKALDSEQAVVYQLEGDRLRNITSVYQTSLPKDVTGLPNFVRAGEPLFADQFGPEWNPLESGFRWMGPRGTVKLGNPPGARTFQLRGWIPDEVAALKGHLQAKLDGVTVGRIGLSRQGNFEFTSEIPENLRDRRQLTLQLDCDRTWVPPGDGRSLCAAFGEFGLR